MVITLCHQIGNGHHSDCVQYFPLKSGAKISYLSLSVECESLVENPFSNHRVLKLKGKDSVQTVTHIHFTGWPDWETPIGESQLEFKNVVEQGASFVEKQHASSPEAREKLLVHCRAGIGRTGTTIALINSILLLRNSQLPKEDTQISVFSIVRRLREQRIYMVQT